MVGCAIQFEFDDFFFPYLLGVFSLWKHFETIIFETFQHMISHTRLLKDTPIGFCLHDKIIC